MTSSAPSPARGFTRRSFTIGLAASALAVGTVGGADRALAVQPPPRFSGRPPRNQPATPFFAEVPLWDSSSDATYVNFHVHAVAVSAAETLLAFTEGRYEVCDAGPRDIVLRRSHDGGATWAPTQVVVASINGQSWGNPAVVVDRATCEIFLFFNLGMRDEGNTTCSADRGDIYVSSSIDDGETWSSAASLAHLFAENDYAWTLHSPGPGAGIQLRGGRLFVPAHHRREIVGTTAATRLYGVQGFYSDDHGRSWHVAEPIPVSAEYPMNEPRAFEREDGAVVVNARNAVGGSNYRITAVSTDRGTTFGPPVLDTAIAPYRPTDSALRRLSGGAGSRRQGRLLFSHPAATTRSNMTLSMSYDEGYTYPVEKLIHAGPSFYSDLAVLSDGTIVLLYGKDGANGSAPQIVAAAHLNVEWLTDSADWVGGPDPVDARAFELASPHARTSSGARPEIVDDVNARGGAKAVLSDAGAGAWIEAPFAIDRSGTYALAVRLERTADVAVVTAGVDGADLPGGLLDPYLASRSAYQVYPLGAATLDRGWHELRLTLTSAGAGGGLRLGADHLTAERID